MGVVRLLSVLLELTLAVAASRSSLMGALIRTANPPSNLHLVLDFLTGLSSGELECLAEFQGACLLEMCDQATNPYRMLSEFFDPAVSERWRNCEDRAHKTFVVLSWLEVQKTPQISALVTHAA
jgi:hypothetical protein